MAEMKVPSYATKPTIGRIVIYAHPSHGFVPAIVQMVFDNEVVRLCAFIPTGTEMVETAEKGSGDGMWSWPKREGIEGVQ